MSFKIRKNELSEELKSDIVFQEDLQEAIENVDVDLSNYTTKEDLQEALTDDSLLTNDKSLVGAINELFQSANNGKQLIASAIGNELITGNSTFKAMSEAILALRSSSDNETDAKEVLYNMMIEDGYNEATSEMTVDELIELLDDSQIDVNEIKQISCGYHHTFILKNDGSVWSCGSNIYGQLGTGTIGGPDTFTQVPDITNVKEIACGYSHTFILKNDGSVWSCGKNDYGQLGLNDTGNRKTFTKVTTNINNDVKEIACGYDHTFILKNDGSIWSCGRNNYGQLGLNDETDRDTFTQVTTNISNVKQIVCGMYHSFILKNDGSAWSCGRNDIGQLGLDNKTNQYTFTQVNTNINNDVKQIACAYDFTFILKNDGSIWSCGRNNYGQLGLGSVTAGNSIFTQVTTNISDVKEIVCGNNQTFILKNDGSLWSCGENNYGQLGLNDETERTIFTQVTTNINNDVKQIAGGQYHTFILKNDDTVWSCGYNVHGQLGLNDTTNRNTFTQVPLSFQAIDEYEINRQKLYYYLLDKSIDVTESMDIGIMLDLLVDDYVDNMINEYYNNLRLILIDAGVEVTEEDDMNDLIFKTSESLGAGGGLDIISATELPATGKENQICVITDNPTNKFIISSDEMDTLTDTGLIYIITSLSAFGANVNLSINDNITQSLYIDRITQNNVKLQSFIYTNGEWVEFTPNYVYIILNNKVQTNEFGGLQTTGGKVTHSSANGYSFSMSGAGANVYVATTSKNTVDFSKYSTVVIKLKTSDEITDRGIGIYLASTPASGTQSTTQKASQVKSVTASTDIYYEYSFDITSWTTTGYFGIEASAKYSSYIYISDIYFM